MIKPHGSDSLNPRLVSDERAQQLLTEAESLPSLILNSAAAANAVMLGAGYFNPLAGYMNLADAISVSESLHTQEGLFWPVPVLNLVKDIQDIEGAKKVALRDPNTEGNPIMAVMDIDAIETVSDAQIISMAEAIFGTTDPQHPGVATFTNLGRFVISGDVEVLSLSYFQLEPLPVSFLKYCFFLDQLIKYQFYLLIQLFEILFLSNLEFPLELPLLNYQDFFY